MRELSNKMLKLLSISAVLAWVLVSLVLPIANTPEVNAQGKCSVKITSPKPGEGVGNDKMVEGTATIPIDIDGYLWVLARKKGQNRWWPQGGAPTAIKKGNWSVTVTFGTPKELGTFEIVAIVVDNEVNQDLKQWAQDAPDNGYSRPIELPTSFCETPIISVEKTKH